jgi:hypothetical protein
MVPGKKKKEAGISLGRNLMLLSLGKDYMWGFRTGTCLLSPVLTHSEKKKDHPVQHLVAHSGKGISFGSKQNSAEK